jgi:hypothetical protein
VNPPRSSTDPLGRRALFSASPQDDPGKASNGAGMQALFTVGNRRFGTVVVNCSSCGARSRVTWVDFWGRHLPFWLWIPGLHYSHWIPCPACERRSWVGVSWLS